MDLKEKMNRFNKRWDIESGDGHYEKFRKFKIAVLNILSDVDRYISHETAAIFCRFWGIPENWQSAWNDREYGTHIITRLRKEDDEKTFYKLVEFVFALDIQSLYGPRNRVEYSKDILLLRVLQAIDFSSINLVATKTKEGEIIFYPKGEKSLDQGIVNKALSFLNENSNQHFILALKDYQSKRWIKSGEGLRRSLEEFLRHELKNKFGLQKNIKEIGKRLKSNQNDTQIRNIISQIFKYIDQFFNENTKHQDGDFGEEESEFLIYQVGLLMRYIHQCNL